MIGEKLLHKRDTEPSWRITSHILFWIIFFCISVYLFKISFNPFGDLPLSYLEPFRRTIILILVFYPLVYLVGKDLLNKKFWGRGVVATILLFLLYSVLDYVTEVQTLKHCEVCNEAVASITPEYHRYLQSGFFNVMLSRLLSLGLLFSTSLLSYHPHCYQARSWVS